MATLHFANIVGTTGRSPERSTYGRAYIRVLIGRQLSWLRARLHEAFALGSLTCTDA